MEDSTKLKNVLRMTGFHPAIGRNEARLNHNQSSNRMLPSITSCLSPFKKGSQVSFSPMSKRYEKVKMKIGASSIMVKTSRMNQFKKQSIQNQFNIDIIKQISKMSQHQVSSETLQNSKSELSVRTIA